MSQDCPTCNQPIYNVRGAIAEMESTVRKAREDGAKAERERILAIVEEEAGQYSYKEEMVRPSIVAAIFLNSVLAKVAQKEAQKEA